LEPLLNSEPDSFLFGDLRAVILSRLGRHAETAECYRHLTGIHPKIVFLWMRYAYALKTVGRTGECIVAYRKGIELSPSLGEAFWGLSDLKTFRFSDADVSEMETQLKRRDLSADNRTYFHFALGKAYHDTTDYQSAFQQFARANALRRIGMEYSPELTTERVSVYKKFFSTQLFAKRVGWGHDSTAPIFVVGMHRAGSTLIEQILCSHSSIDGIGEAQEVALIATSLESEVAPRHRVPYPEVIGQFDGDGLRQLGEKYLKAARELHHGTLPFFVDKNPVNFWNTGLIHLILPNAKIVDVRRHPMACCFSNFTSGFESELRHTYKQSDLGRYYVAYADLMAHFDRVLPGRIHRVNYERLVADTEAELWRLFEYLGIPFERRCLEFHQTTRAVLTPSSEQVRRPINQEGINRWRHYEAWLGPLKAALEPVLASYPECAKG
jgi:tetratricopeptide (TPR) repeat protein